jgi:acid phosphatase (class A)
MVQRTLTLLLAAVALSASANCFAAEFTFLEPKQVELLRLVPPPPPPNSEAQKQDMAAVLEAQKNRTPAVVSRALADNILSIWVYADVMGPNFSAEKLPIFNAFFATMHADARILLSQTKDVWGRVRPPAVSTDVVPLGGKTRLPYGYPSGGVMFSTLTAIMLANMVPEKQFELFERAREYGSNRVVLGVHYPRDVEGGHMAAAAAAQAFFTTPAFMKELEGAREELRRILGYGEIVTTGTAKPAAE